MHQAVEAAGVLQKRFGVADTTLSFVSEPEAAALATLKRVDGRCDVGADDCFVVCDCGGGTVDLIAYQVMTVEPMKIREIVKGSGGLAGASFLGARFKSLVKDKLHEISPGLWRHVSARDMEEIMSEEWPNMRRVFKGDPAQSFTIRIPMSLFEAGLLNVRDGRTTIRITSEDLEEVFRPILKKIETLVLGQVHSVLEKQGQFPKVSHDPSEFGLFLYHLMFLPLHTVHCSCWRLRQMQILVRVAEDSDSRHRGAAVSRKRAVSTSANLSSFTMLTFHSWTAICRGAVIHGLTLEKVDSALGVEVKSRIARW